jgi:DNA-binding transcriptional LysR family regulator
MQNPAVSGEAPLHQPWLGVELRHMAALLAVARQGSFRGAAESLGYVQSAVSQQIAHVELLVGTRLVDRHRGQRSVSLTAAGRLLADHAAQMLGQVAAARADLEALSQRPHEFTVGIDHTIASRSIARVFAELVLQVPEVEVRCHEAAPPDDLCQLVVDGQVDAVLLELPLASDALVAERLASDPFVLLVSAESELAQIGAPVSAEQIGQLSLIGPPPSPVFEHLESDFGARGVRLRYSQPWPGLASLHAFVSVGLGAAIVPRLATDPACEATRTLPLADTLSLRSVGIAWHQARRASPLVAKFRDAAVSCLSGDGVAQAESAADEQYAAVARIVQ